MSRRCCYSPGVWPKTKLFHSPLDLLPMQGRDVQGGAIARNGAGTRAHVLLERRPYLGWLVCCLAQVSPLPPSSPVQVGMEHVLSKGPRLRRSVDLPRVYSWGVTEIKLSPHPEGAKA